MLITKKKRLCCRRWFKKGIDYFSLILCQFAEIEVIISRLIGRQKRANLRCKQLTLASVAFSLVSVLPPQSGAYAENQPKLSQDARWITAGSFVVSGFPNNPKREKSYRGTSREDRRVSTYLPSMTAVYNVETSNSSSLSQGITQFGFPVRLREEDLSASTFSQRSDKDVVVHLQHTACRDIVCEREPVHVGVGSSFTIFNETENQVELFSAANEFRLVYRSDRFEKLQSAGFLTRFKDRLYPRLAINEGYASELSTGCGELYSPHGEFEIPLTEYRVDPLQWDLNDRRWDLKAIEVFNLGSFSIDEDLGVARGKLSASIGIGENVAIDLTLFALLESAEKDFVFLGLAQVVNCESNPLGRIDPGYVDRAFVYFSENLGGERSFSTEVEMPQQLNQKMKSDIFRYVGRSFFYSINSAQEYQAVFEAVSDAFPRPAFSALLISRLNSSCGVRDRRRCSVITSTGIVSNNPPKPKPK